MGLETAFRLLLGVSDWLKFKKVFLFVPPFYRNELTSSEVVKNGWAYVTTIGLYDLDYSPEPLIVARLANPLKRDSRVPITFKLKVDNIV